MPAFSAREFLRYSRHFQLPNLGVEGQLALKNSHAAVVGCGGLGAPLSQYLAAAGVGRLTLIDGDQVELSNLQRQVLFTEADIGQSKATCTAQRLSQLNSDIDIRAEASHLASNNCEALLSTADVVIDCTDNFSARYLINDFCKRQKKPWVYASIFQYSGQLAVFSPEGACFRCLFPEPPLNTPDCNAAGVLGALPGVLGSLQATEVLKLLSGATPALLNHLLMVETSDMMFQKLAMRATLSCPACNGELEKLNPELFYTPVCASDNLTEQQVDAEEFNQLVQNKDEYRLVDVRSAAEHNAFHIDGEHIALDDIPAWLDSLHESRTLLFYCQSGARSNLAVTQTIENGKKALSLRGGLQHYLQATQ